MKKQKNKGKIIIWIACVLSFVAVAFNLLSIIALSFNLFGIVDILESTINNLGYTLGTDLSLACMELSIVALIDLFAGLRYVKIAKNKFNLSRLGHHLTMQSILQIFFGSFIAGILACIGISILVKKAPAPVTHEEQVEYINDFKKKAMGEAIARLKELKAQGAISEEEYNETLNKILEG